MDERAAALVHAARHDLTRLDAAVAEVGRDELADLRALEVVAALLVRSARLQAEHVSRLAARAGEP